MRWATAIRIWSRRCRSRRRSSGTCRTCSRARTARSSPRGCASRALPIWCSSAIPARKRWNARSRSRAAITSSKGHPERYRLITFEGAFHGRTLGTLAATGSAKYLEGFGPPLDGFDQVPHGDLEAVKKAIGPQHRRHPDRAGAGRGRRALRAAMPSSRRCASSATSNGLLLIFDEVQTGMGRTGDLFAYKRLGVTPGRDVAGEGARRRLSDRRVLATAEAASGMTPGSHGSTFGGNPLAIAAANAVLDVMLKPGFFDHVQKMSLLLKQKLASVVDRYPAVLVGSARRGACWSASRPWCPRAISSMRCATRNCSPSAPATMWCGSWRR